TSKKAGKDLVNPLKWVTRGADEQAIWGECQGSGSKPYQTQIDLSSITFKCSCPSRKFPCKHGVALGLLYARQPDAFTQREAPAWVTEWISKRAQKEEKKTEKKDKPVDEAAQAKRQLAREEKVSDGIKELMIWIKDIVRNGIISMPEKDFAFWQGMSKRMVDAQAPGLAGMIKSICNINYFKEGWQSEFLDNLLNLYLAAKGYQNRALLEPGLLQDLRSWIGFTVNQEELKQQQGVLDTWLVLGKQVTDDDNLTVERTWLYGTGSNRYALVLQFIVKGQSSAALLFSPGMYIDAELVYYPSVAPMRALIKRHIANNAKMPQQLYRGWKDVVETETAICSSFPVRGERPYIIAQLVPVLHHGKWWLKDRSHNMMPVREGPAGIWKLLSLSGGHALDTVVIGKENTYEPIGVWNNEYYKVI
ncbi:MAG TPA: SWIM zinc finger family protein, partial [Flavisolibacter sp.]|nr:SWIM zinc finger family protein [Flavisolibacter sp.]